MDLRNKIVSLVYGPAGKEAASTSLILNGLMGNLAKICAWRNGNISKGNDGPFLVGNAATVVDFNLW